MRDYMENDIEDVKGTISKIVGSIGIGFVFIGLLIFGYSCTYKVDPGYAGVIYSMDGGIETETLGQGFHVVAPWKKVIEYPVSTETVYYTKNNDDGDEKKDNSINVNTKDGKQVNVSVTYAYHMDEVQLPSVFEKFRGQKSEVIEAGFLKNELYKAINEVTSQYSLMDLIGEKRPEINNKILLQFRDSLEEYGIIIETFNLSDVVTDDQTKDAIQAVINAQNALEQAKIEKEKAIVESEKRVTEAKGYADAAIIKASGESEANEKLRNSLTPLIVEQKKIEKWNGELPKFSGSNSMLTLSME